MEKNMTVFYTENFGEKLAEINEIVNLNIDDIFTYKEQLYKVVWKLYNIEDNIMIYHGK